MPDGRPKLIELTTGHRTKAEIEMRRQAEKSLYTGERFLESKQVKENEIAHKEFVRLRKLFSKITFVDALDQQIINRYCLEVANQHRLAELMETVEEKLDDADEYFNVLKIVTRLLSEMNKSKELLLKYEDRLFLNPAGRVKAIPKTPPKQEEEATGIKAFLKNRVESS